MYLDELVLSDGSRLVVMVVIGDASSFRVFAPSYANLSLGDRGAKRCLSAVWAA